MSKNICEHIVDNEKQEVLMDKIGVVGEEHFSYASGSDPLSYIQGVRSLYLFQCPLCKKVKIQPDED